MSDTNNTNPAKTPRLSAVGSSSWRILTNVPMNSAAIRPIADGLDISADIPKFGRLFKNQRNKYAVCPGYDKKAAIAASIGYLFTFAAALVTMKNLATERLNSKFL